MPTASATSSPEVGSWVIVWQGRTWTENDLTGAHAAVVTLMSGADAWQLLDPMRGPVTLMQILAAFIAIADERDPLGVMGDLGRSSLKDLLAAISIVE